MIDFISNHFVLLLSITIFLIFALIGYIYDTKKNKESIFKQNEDQIDEEAVANLAMLEGKSIKESVTNSKNINPETGGVELVDSTITNNSTQEETIDNDIKS